MNEWQPIATAPKDLTEVLVYDPDYGGVVVAQYEMYATRPFWSSDIHDFTTGGHKIEPTHWQPLPPPPAKEPT